MVQRQISTRQQRQTSTAIDNDGVGMDPGMAESFSQACLLGWKIREIRLPPSAHCLYRSSADSRPGCFQAPSQDCIHRGVSRAYVRLSALLAISKTILTQL